MSNLLEFGAMVNRREALKQSCAFIHNEGPIRLAHMIQEMRTLPDLFLSQPMINRVYNWYLASFRDMIESPSMFATEDDVAKYSSGFADVLRGILRRHGPTVMTIALGFKNLRDHGQLKGFDIYVQEFLNRFFMSRISVRFLFSQHLALFADETKPAVTDAKSRWIGAIREYEARNIIRPSS
jgi:pyruvate dehydrogenase kinase 2/3/4